MNEVRGGFAIYTSDQGTLEDNARELVYYATPSIGREEESKSWISDGLITEDGEITNKGWDVYTEGVIKLEHNIVAWLREKFSGASDEGHDTYGELIGSLWADLDNPEHTKYLYDSFGDLFDENWYAYDLGREDYEKWFDGVSDFVAWIEDPALHFFDFPKELPAPVA